MTEIICTCCSAKKYRTALDFLPQTDSNKDKAEWMLLHGDALIEALAMADRIYPAQESPDVQAALKWIDEQIENAKQLRVPNVPIFNTIRRALSRQQINNRAHDVDLGLAGGEQKDPAIPVVEDGDRKAACEAIGNNSPPLTKDGALESMLASLDASDYPQTALTGQSYRELRDEMMSEWIEKHKDAVHDLIEAAKAHAAQVDAEALRRPKATSYNSYDAGWNDLLDELIRRNRIRGSE